MKKGIETAVTTKVTTRKSVAQKAKCYAAKFADCFANFVDRVLSPFMLLVLMLVEVMLRFFDEASTVLARGLRRLFVFSMIVVLVCHFVPEVGEKMPVVVQLSEYSMEWVEWNIDTTFSMLGSFLNGEFPDFGVIGEEILDGAGRFIGFIKTLG